MQTTFDTEAECLAAGFRKPERRLGDRDISGGHSFGYKYRSLDRQETVTIWFNKEKNHMGNFGCFSPLFPPVPGETDEQRKTRLDHLMDVHYWLHRAFNEVWGPDEYSDYQKLEKLLTSNLRV